MKTNLHYGILFMISCFFASNFSAQTYETLEVNSGFNADVIANGVGSALSSTTIDVDGVSFNFISKDFKPTPTSADLTYGLPINGFFTSAVASTSGLYYQLNSYNSNNALRLAAISDVGTVSFTTPKAANRLFMISTSGSGTSTVNIVVNFTDSTTETFSDVAISDWYGGSNFAISGFGRVNRNTNALENGGGTNPRIYQTLLDISAANESKLIQSVAVTKASGTGIPNIFGFSVDLHTSCIAPTNFTVSASTATSITTTWTTPASAPALGYDVYINTSSTSPPTSSTIPMANGATTSFAFVGLTPNTNYCIWVRSKCGNSDVSGWVGPTCISTACSPISTFPWTENFDTLGNIGSTTPPNCWANVAGTTGWKSANASTSSYNGPKSAPNFMQIAYGNTNARQLWSPAFNLVAGTSYDFSFFYNTNGTASNFIGFTGNVLVNTTPTVTGATDLGNFITANQGTTSYTKKTTAFVPATSGTYYFAVNVSSTSAPWYLGVDDFAITTTLGTSETIKNDIFISPNPFINEIQISDIKGLKSITVYDLSGRLILALKPTKILKLSSLKSEVYILNLQYEDGTVKTTKIIKN